MIPINTQMIVMNRLTSSLVDDVQKLRDGKIDKAKANSLARLSGKVISSIAQGVMTANHQAIQRQKIEVSKMNAESKIEHVKIQKAKLKSIGIRIDV
jgi:hypothetical protein